jgi:hypothetical protein
MLFFQSGLLLGYLYAHSLARRISPKHQGIIHTILLIGSLAALPILPNSAWQPKPGADPTLGVFGVLATSVGLPYLLLSSTSPLLQTWYARVNQGALPYRYFALSNAGSMVALLGYPILVEPYLTGHQQAWVWSGAYAFFAVLCVGTALFSRRNAVPQTVQEDQSAKGGAGAGHIFLWLSLAACASTLLLAVTNMLTQNIAPMPFLWVLPLSLYLLTFILCFESDRWYRRDIFLALTLPALGCLAATSGPLRNGDIGLIIPLLCAALFVCCMTCHGELAKHRPAVGQLTTFYLCLSAGGAVGGLFVALFAPHVFKAMYEYPIAFVSCAALLLVVLWRENSLWKNQRLGVSLWIFAFVGTIALAGYTCRETWWQVRGARLLARNFYGALRVQDTRGDTHMIQRELSHGTITHGVQLLDPKFRRTPTTYYAWDSGIGLTWRTLAPLGPIRMGVVGLGAGTLAAYGRDGDTIRFYEINPRVRDIASTQFTYLLDCPAEHDIVLGDARLSMAREPSQQFDILVIDAFSGDAIPVHLLTKEAFQVYWHHLKPNGILAVHISNRYLNLGPVAVLGEKAFGKKSWLIENEDDDKIEVYSSSYILSTSRHGFFESALFRGQKEKVDIPPHLRAWTDDYSNLWEVLKYE